MQLKSVQTQVSIRVNAQLYSFFSMDPPLPKTIKSIDVDYDRDVVTLAFIDGLVITVPLYNVAYYQEFLEHSVENPPLAENFSLNTPQREMTPETPPEPTTQPITMPEILAETPILAVSTPNTIQDTTIHQETPISEPSASIPEPLPVESTPTDDAIQAPIESEPKPLELPKVTFTKRTKPAKQPKGKHK